MDADACGAGDCALGIRCVLLQLCEDSVASFYFHLRYAMAKCYFVTGVVRSPILTTTMQVSSRLLLIWAVVNRYPAATAPLPFYSSMLLAWSVTEVIRYSYFVWNLRGQGVPAFVTWLRYNTFYVLYPIGISSECVLIWKASMVAERPLPLVFWGVLGVYVPGRFFPHWRTEGKG